jgi:hypothetical protein
VKGAAVFNTPRRQWSEAATTRDKQTANTFCGGDELIVKVVV